MNFLLCDKCNLPMKAYPTKVEDPGSGHTVDAIWWECRCGNRGYGWDLGEDEVEVYFDGVHLWSPCADALHWLAGKIGLKRAHFQARARHPHYDAWGKPAARVVEHEGVMWVSKREMIAYMQFWAGQDFTVGLLSAESHHRIQAAANSDYHLLAVAGNEAH